jgi:hypothetical protein
MIDEPFVMQFVDKHIIHFPLKKNDLSESCTLYSKMLMHIPFY